MTPPEFIVEELPAVRRDGTRTALVVRVGKPVKDATGDDPHNNTHACVVACEGICDIRPIRVYGEGPMQALHLALRAVRLHLECAEEDGLRFIYPDGQPYDWRRLWYGDGADSARTEGIDPADQ